MKILMFVEDGDGMTTFRILNISYPRQKHRKLFPRDYPVRIYWFWEDKKHYGSNFKSVMRRMETFGYNKQEEIYTI